MKKTIQTLAIGTMLLTGVVSAQQNVLLVNSQKQVLDGFKYDDSSIIDGIKTRVYCGAVYLFSSKYCVKQTEKAIEEALTEQKKEIEKAAVEKIQAAEMKTAKLEQQLAQQQNSIQTNTSGSNSDGNLTTLNSVGQVDNGSVEKFNNESQNGAQPIIQKIYQVVEKAVPGPRGAAGPQGPQGLPGQQGATGPAGTGGTSGSTGYVPGAQYFGGSQGAAGQNGRDGSNGINGTSVSSVAASGSNLVFTFSNGTQTTVPMPTGNGGGTGGTVTIANGLTYDILTGILTSTVNNVSSSTNIGTIPNLVIGNTVSGAGLSASCVGTNSLSYDSVNKKFVCGNITGGGTSGLTNGTVSGSSLRWNPTLSSWTPDTGLTSDGGGNATSTNSFYTNTLNANSIGSNLLNAIKAGTSNVLNLTGNSLTSTVNGITSATITLPSSGGNFTGGTVSDINITGNATATTITGAGLQTCTAGQALTYSSATKLFSCVTVSTGGFNGGTINGNFTVQNALTNLATTTVVAIDGAGLTSCNGVGDKLAYNASTKQFECKTDQTGGGSGLTNGTSVNNTLRWNGTAWVETPNWTVDAAGNATGTKLSLTNMIISGITGGISGLKLAINSGTATTTATGKVLAVNATGDVVQVDAATGGSGSSNAFVQSGNSFGATAVLGTLDNQDFNLKTNNITRLAVTKNGNTTFNAPSTGGNGLTNFGGVNGYGTFTQAGPTAGYGGLIAYDNTALAYSVLGKNDGSGIYCQTSGTGTCGGSVNWSNLSDSRLKKNVQNLSRTTQGLSAVLKLRPVTYDWKDVNSNPKQQIGFIAQEVEEVFPQIVHTSVDSKTIKMQDGSSETILNPKSMTYGELVVPIVAAIQELSANISSFAEQIITKVLRTEILCVGVNCVNGDQFKQILQSSGVQTSQSSTVTPSVVVENSATTTATSTWSGTNGTTTAQ
jgi:trimeric autotransporter adhesin